MLKTNCCTSRTGQLGYFLQPPLAPLSRDRSVPAARWRWNSGKSTAPSQKVIIRWRSWSRAKERCRERCVGAEMLAEKHFYQCFFIAQKCLLIFRARFARPTTQSSRYHFFLKNGFGRFRKSILKCLQYFSKMFIKNIFF